MKIVLIEWSDACGSHTWENRDDPVHILPCTSVGILLREDEKEIEIAQTLNPSHKNNCLAIPKSWIKRIRPLCLR